MDYNTTDNLQSNGLCIWIALFITVVVRKYNKKQQ